MLVSIPKNCNPDLPWYQGKVFYEVFPASFKDSNKDGTGDLKGLLNKLDYIQELGASAIRLNYIYEALKYPDQYFNITSLVKVDRSVGLPKDFQDLIKDVHKRNMSLILDLPVVSLAKSDLSANFTQAVLIANETITNNLVDPTSAAIIFWARQKVDGFYLKDLENFVDDVSFGRSLQLWKQVLGSNKIFIASENAYDKVKGDALKLNVFLSRIDLIDIHLDLNSGVTGLKNRIDKVIKGVLWEKPHYPWVHWNIGSVHNERISTKHINNTLVLTALELALPGTVSIFYGDEIGLGELGDIERDFHEHKDIGNIVSMSFPNEKDSGIILPWISKSERTPSYHILDVIKLFTKVKLDTPTIYLRSIYKDGNVLKNTEIRETEENLVVIERWYPRRNTCVFVGNLGSQPITTDLSTMFYGGTVLAGTNVSLVGQVLYLEKITFPPYSAIILKLEK